VIVVPNSGQFVRPRMMLPAARSFSTMKLVDGGEEASLLGGA
jgi:hypothetical protein